MTALADRDPRGTNYSRASRDQSLLTLSMLQVTLHFCTPPAWQPPPLQGRSFIAQRLAAVIPIITGTVKKHNGGPVCCRPLCEACLKISAGINYFQYSRANQGPQHPANKRKPGVAPLRASNVCDDGNFSSPKECALAPAPDRMLAYGGMSKGRL